MEKQSSQSLTRQKPFPKKLFIAAGTCLLIVAISVGIYFSTGDNNNNSVTTSGKTIVDDDSTIAASPPPTKSDVIDNNSDNSADSSPTTNIDSTDDIINHNDSGSDSGSGSDENSGSDSGSDTGSGSDSIEEVGCIKTPIVSNSIPQEYHQSIVEVEEVTYTKGKIDKGEMDLQLDIYHPAIKKQGDKYPLMINIHGGSFTSGSKSDGYIQSSSEFWAHHGFVVAAINYRLMGDSPVLSTAMEPVYEYVVTNLDEVLKSEAQAQAATCAVEDTLAAYDYLQNLDYVDKNVVVMNGYSAGAITALWATYGVDNFDIERPPVKAVFSHWGLLVTSQEETNKLVPRSNEPPVFLVHATGDGIVPYDGTQYLANRQHSLDMPYVLHCQNSGSHAIGIDNTAHSDNMSILDAELIWIENILYGK